MPRYVVWFLFTLGLLLNAFSTAAARAQCTPSWLETAGLPGFDNTCNALITADIGSGTRLYAGGAFTVAGGADALRVAVFDGVRWSALGNSASAGLNNGVNALTVFNGELIAGGDFTASGTGAAMLRVARFDGAAWQPLGAGLNGSVNALAVFGGELYAGGAFTLSGAASVLRVAKWNGTAWVAVGAGFGATVNALVGYGGSLYAGGQFTASGATSMNSIARFDGTNWQPVGAPTALTGGSSFRGVNAFLVFNTDLIVAGGFTALNGSACNYVASWNGSTWTPMSAPAGGATNAAFTLASYAGQVVVGGAISFSGGVHTARWTGSAWQSLGGAYNTPSFVYALAPFNGSLIVGGTFTLVGEVPSLRVAAYTGSGFTTLGAGLETVVYDTAVWNDSLYLAGAFTGASGTTARKIARYDGIGLTPLAVQLPTGGQINSLEVHNAELYAGGSWGAGLTQHLARWNGSTWTGITAPITSAGIGVLRSFSGSLVAGGTFNNGFQNVGRWDGTTWIAMGAGLNGEVQDLILWNGELYAAGSFTASGATPCALVARWDGTNWQPLGTGTATISSGSRVCLTTFAGDLVIAGTFTNIGGVPVNSLARWNGSAWTPITGLASGASITACGNFAGSLVVAGRVNVTAAANYVALFDGGSWSAIGPGFSGKTLGGTSGPSVYAVDTFQGDLCVAGDFFRAGARVSSFLARYGSEPPCVLTSPAGSVQCPGDSISLLAVVTGAPALTFQWRRGGQPLTDGPTAAGTIYSGVHSASLSIANLRPADTGTYDLLITNAYSSATTTPALISILPPCNLADITFIGGDVGTPGCPDGLLTVDDLILFVNLFSDGSGCPGAPSVPCSYADVCGIGGPPEPSDGQLTVDDIIAFVNAFSEGC